MKAAIERPIAQQADIPKGVKMVPLPCALEPRGGVKVFVWLHSAVHRGKCWEHHMREVILSFLSAVELKTSISS